MRHGAGDPHWFGKLDRQTQIDILALDRAEAQEAEEARKAAAKATKGRR